MRENDADDAFSGAWQDEHVRQSEERNEHQKRFTTFAVLLRLHWIGRTQLRDQNLPLSKYDHSNEINNEKKNQSSIQKWKSIITWFNSCTKLLMKLINTLINDEGSLALCTQ